MEKVRFGVVGTNFITDWLIEGARLDPRFELTAEFWLMRLCIFIFTIMESIFPIR